MSKVFCIGEIGINHNGDMKLAKELISMAKDCDADAVKFQKRNIDLVYSKEILDSLRESPWGKTQRDQKSGLEFNLDQYAEIDEYCKSININWFISAWDVDSLNSMDIFDLKYQKIASPMIVDKVFLNEVAKKKKYTFISTGMSNTQNIENAVEIFKKYNCPFELMHCVSTYPMKPDQANLVTIPALGKKFSCKVGYSGHENGLAISYAAVALGATSIERHITMDRTMYGSDQSASLEPKGFKELIGAIRKITTALGEEKIGHIFDEEKPNAEKLRAHIKY